MVDIPLKLISFELLFRFSEKRHFSDFSGMNLDAGTVKADFS